MMFHKLIDWFQEYSAERREREAYVWKMTRTTRYIMFGAMCIAMGAERLDWGWLEGLMCAVILLCWAWIRVMTVSAKNRPELWRHFD